MSRKIKINADLVEAAADEVHEAALELQLNNTVDGEWPTEEKEAKDNHDYLMELHGKLCEAMA